MVGRSPERLLAVGRACRRGCVAQIGDQFRKQKSRQRRHSIPQQPNRLLPLLWMRCCAGFSTSSWASLQSRRSENGATDARAACRSGWTVPNPGSGSTMKQDVALALCLSPCMGTRPPPRQMARLPLCQSWLATQTGGPWRETLSTPRSARGRGPILSHSTPPRRAGRPCLASPAARAHSP